MRPPSSQGVAASPAQLQTFLDQLQRVLSGNISFGSTGGVSDRNILCTQVSGTSPGVSDTEFTVAHNLGRIPIGFIVVSVDKAAIIYKSTTAWTSSNIYLKANATSVSYVLLVI